MSSIVCQQGFQSCLEPRFVEPRTLGLKLALPKPVLLLPQALQWASSPTTTTTTTSTFDSIPNIEDHNNNNDDDDNNNVTNIINSNFDNGGWDFIQALENSSKNFVNEAKKEKETPYVHPLVKRYSSKLSKKSLELCTENLGCETGSDIGEYSDVYSNSSSDSEDAKSPTRDRSYFRQSLITLNKKKVINNGTLPPPLTSISGSNCVQVRPHREGGRLVIKTVVVPSSHSCFQAERRDGRLRLHFSNNYYSNNQAFEDEQEQHEQEEEGEEEDDQETQNNKEQEVEEEESEAETEVEAEEDFLGEDFLMEDMDGNNCNGGGEMGIEKFQRPSRCKESRRGKNGLLIWEPFWVAT